MSRVRDSHADSLGLELIELDSDDDAELLGPDGDALDDSDGEGLDDAELLGPDGDALDDSDGEGLDDAELDGDDPPSSPRAAVHSSRPGPRRSWWGSR